MQALFKGYYYDKTNHQIALPSTKQNSVMIDSISKDNEKDIDKDGDFMGEENVIEDGE